MKQLMLILCRLLAIFVCCQHVFAASQFDEQQQLGRKQYELIKDRIALPNYGDCWKQALDRVESGCRNLSEQTQSVVAMHLTNCFLEMTGLETYNCFDDKKPNLKKICLEHMPDRAFNAYLEFYTHTQNICWFLWNQVWYEEIVTNTMRVAGFLKASAKTQADLLAHQRESLKLQERIMDYGRNLEHLLGSFVDLSQDHKELLNALTSSVVRFQSWLIAEVAWLDSVVFYVSTSLTALFLTSVRRTRSARLPVLMLLCANVLVERAFCNAVSELIAMNVDEMHVVYRHCVWSVRYTVVLICAGVIIYAYATFMDYAAVNNLMLIQLLEGVEELKGRMVEASWLGSRATSMVRDVYRRSPSIAMSAHDGGGAADVADEEGDDVVRVVRVARVRPNNVTPQRGTLQLEGNAPYNLRRRTPR